MKFQNLYTKLIGVLMVFSVMAFVPHKYYMSITQIDHNSENKHLEITMKLFTDDLEKAIEEGTTEKLRLGTKEESSKADDLIKKYLGKHFTMKLNGTPVTYKYVGKEVNVEVVWVYLEVVNTKSISSVTVKNSMLIDVIEQQKNVVKLNVNGKFDSHVMTKDNEEKEFNF